MTATNATAARRPPHRGLALVALLSLHAVACGAPASRPAEGPIADQVAAALSSGSAAFDHSAWDGMLAAGTVDGRVDYGYMAAHRAELDAYLDSLAGANLPSLAPDHLKALLINAYNAYTVRSILDHSGVESIRDIDGVWTEATHAVGGHQLTLDEMEHNLLRPFFKDPRIHFAVNCASASCAPLPRWAFDGDRLDEQLEERSRAFLTDPANVRVEGDTLYLSSYFDWYGDDFFAAGWSPRAESYVEFVARYATEEVAELVDAAGGAPKVSFLDYDWSLNQAGV